MQNYAVRFVRNSKCAPSLGGLESCIWTLVCFLFDEVILT